MLRSAALRAGFSLLFLLGCDAPSGSVMVAVRSEASVPAELDQFEIKVARGDKAFSQRYAAPEALRLPGTLTIANDTAGSDEPLLVTVSARKGDGEGWRVSRSARLTFVAGKTKLLRVPLSYACFDRPCPDGQTCAGGQCVGVDVDSGSLADLSDPSEALPSRGQRGCFDPSRCLDNPVQAEVDDQCRFALPAGNAAATWKYAPGKLVTLEPSPVEGYSLQGGVATLAPGLCDALRQGKLLAVYTSAACETKSLAAAFCADAGEPDPLAGQGGMSGASGQGGAGQGGAGQGGAGQGGAGQGGQGGKPPYCGDGVINLAMEACDEKDFGEATCASVSGDETSTGVLHCSACQIKTYYCSRCGDGQVNGLEECDGEKTYKACADFLSAYTKGDVGCTTGCKFDVSTCPFCGDGKINLDEACDGADLGGKSCESVLGAGVTGELACNGCQLDISGCSQKFYPGLTDGHEPGALWPMYRGHASGWAQSGQLTLDNPKMAWAVQRPVTGSPVIAADGTIYFASGNDLVAVDPGGNEKWVYTTGGETGRSPLITPDGSVVVAASDSYLYWVKPDGTLKSKATHPYAKPKAFADLVANKFYVAATSQDPALQGSTMLFALNGGGSNQLFSTVDIPTLSPVVAPDGAFWVAFKVDQPNYILLSPADSKGPFGIAFGAISAPPIFGAGGDWFINTALGKLHAATWTLEGVGASSQLSVSPSNVIHVAAAGGDLSAVNPDGTLRWVYKPALPLAGASVATGDGVVYAPGGNRVFAVNPDGSGRWVYTSDSGQPFTGDMAIGLGGQLLLSDGARLIALE